jgi:hypothetical protein
MKRRGLRGSPPGRSCPPRFGGSAWGGTTFPSGTFRLSLVPAWAGTGTTHGSAPMAARLSRSATWQATARQRQRDGQNRQRTARPIRHRPARQHASRLAEPAGLRGRVPGTGRLGGGLRLRPGPPGTALGPGRTRPLPRPPGLLLGIVPTAEYGLACEELAVGDILFCYTDGLIERRDRDLEEGLNSLVTARCLLPARDCR